MNILIRFLPILSLALAAPTSPAVTLEEALNAARENSPTVEAAVRRVEAASASVVEARSAYYPTVTLGGTYTLTDNPPQAFFMNLNQRQANVQSDFNQPDDTDNLRLSTGLKWMLLDGGQRGLSRRLAALREMASSDQLQAARHELTYQVTRAFYFLEQARKNVVVQEATVERIKESLRIANERFEAGAALKTDVLHLEVQLSEATENLIRARNATRLALSALNNAIGTDLVAETTSLTMPGLDPLPILPKRGDFEPEQRPELAAMLKMEEAGRLEERRAFRERMPTLSAFGSVDWDSEAASDFEQSYFAGAALEWDIFTGFRKDARIAAARASSLEQEARRRDLENQLTLELEQAYFNAAEALQRIEATRRSVASAAEAYRITRTRYEEGAADITELLTAQVGQTAMETRNLNATFDYLIALANLQRASGRE
jgi:outer membrane protein